MFKKIFSVILTIVLLFPYLPDTSAYSKTKETEVNLNQNSTSEKSYIIRLNKSVSADNFLKKNKLEKKHKKKLKDNQYVLKLTNDELAKLKKNSDIYYLEPDSSVSLTETFSSNDTENMENSSEVTPIGVKTIGVEQVHDKSINGEGIKVAVFDTGVSNHSDLLIKGGTSFVEGYSSFSDDNGHGTHVAGTIAALNNNRGIIGVSPNVDIYAVKVLDSNGIGNYSSVIEGINWAVQNHINIISISFGGVEYSQALEEAINYAISEGILVVAAAGNKGFGNETMLYPARFPNVLSVGAVDQDLRRATFSSVGSQLDLVAPGIDIISTSNEDNGYSVKSGTSMATPHVTGSAALLWSIDKSKTNKEILDTLQKSVTPIGEKNEYGNGIINIANALGMEFEIKTQPATQAIENFNYKKINSDILDLAKKLDDIQKKANDNLSKEIELTKTSLSMSYKYIHTLPDPLKNTYKEEEIESYYSSISYKFIEIKENYQKFIEIYEDGLNNQDINTNKVFPETELSSYDIKGHPQYVFQGSPATVSVKLGAPKSQIDITVYNESNPSNIITRTTYYNKPADTDIVYTWNVPSTLTPGTYKIRYSYFASSGTTVSDDYFTIYVQQKPVATDNYEPNNSITSATYTGTGETIKSYISSSSDQDYYKFVPNISGTIKIQLQVPSDKDYDLKIFDSANTQIASSTMGQGSTEEVSVSIKAGYAYYINIYGYSGAYSSSQYTLILNSIAPEFKTLLLDTPINVNLPNSQFEVFKFTPPSTGNYKFSTGPYGGGVSINNTILEAYSNSSLSSSSLIGYNDDSNGTYFSELELSLTGGTTYYIKLKPISTGALYTSIMATKSITYYDLVSDIPQDVSLPTGEFRVYKFVPLYSGTYKIFTSSYMNNASTNDTVLELYDNKNLSSPLTQNDDFNGTFSKIEHYFNAHTTYYIKLKPFGSGALNARITINPLITFKEINDGFKEDVALPVFDYKYYSFEPKQSGFYKLDTSSFMNNGVEQNTTISIYKDYALQNQLNFSDDIKHPNPSLFSKLYFNLKVGDKIYIKVGGKNNISANYRLSLSYQVDSDNDFLPDELETNGVRIGYNSVYKETVTTDPNDNDTDGDALSDGIELLELTNYNSDLDMFESIENPKVFDYGSFEGNFSYAPPEPYDWSSTDVATLKELFNLAKGLKEKVDNQYLLANTIRDNLSVVGSEQIDLYNSQLEFIGLNYFNLAESTLQSIEELGTEEDKIWVAAQNWTFSDSDVENVVSSTEVEPDPVADSILKPKYAWLGTAVHNAIEDKYRNSVGISARTEYVIPYTNPKKKLDMAYDTSINKMNDGEAYIWDIKPLSQHSDFNWYQHGKNLNQLDGYINSYRNYWKKPVYDGTKNQWNATHQYVLLANYSTRYKDYLAYFYQFSDEPGFIYYFATKIPRTPDPAIKAEKVRRNVQVSINGDNLEVTTIGRYKNTNKYVAAARVATGIALIVITIANDITGVGIADDAVGIAISAQLIRSGVTLLRANPL
jgi:hypothetical protein